MKRKDRMPPDRPLGPQLRDPSEGLSAFEVLRDAYRFKQMAPDGRAPLPEGYEAEAAPLLPIRTMIRQARERS